MMARRLGAAIVVLSLCVVASGCSGKKKAKDQSGPSPEVTGLAAVPSTARVIIAADVGKLADSPLIDRAVEMLLLRDATLATNWQHLQETCKVDLTTQVKRLMFATGPTTTAEGQGAVGTGPVLVVATGTLSEPDVASCVRGMVGKGGGSLTASTVSGRSLYKVQDGNRTMFFAFGRPDTVILGSNEAWVLEALGTGKKALDNPALKALFAMTNQNMPLWAVGEVDERFGSGLVGATQGKLSAGPKSFVGAFDLTKGAKFDVGVVMASPADAKSLESFATNELKVVGMFAQMKSLGPVVSKLAVVSEASVVRFRAALTMDDVNQLLSVLDEKPAPEQGTPPPSPE